MHPNSPESWEFKKIVWGHGPTGARYLKSNIYQYMPDEELRNVPETRGPDAIQFIAYTLC